MQGKLALKLRPRSGMVFFPTSQLSLLILSNFHLLKKNKNKAEEKKKRLFKGLCSGCVCKNLLLRALSSLYCLSKLTQLKYVLLMCF